MGIFSKSKKDDKYAPAKGKQAEPVSAAAKTAAEKQPAKPAVRGPLAKEGAGRAYRILIEPLLTEKADRQQSLGKYSFIVAPDANKQTVAEAVRDLYGVKPVAVNIVKVKGKNVRFGRTSGKQKDVKKAIITLKEGESISAIEA